MSDNDADDEARAWYHRTLPGGTAGDWRRDYLGRPSEHLALHAADLSLSGRLHINDHGEGVSFRDCSLCTALRTETK